MRLTVAGKELAQPRFNRPIGLVDRVLSEIRFSNKLHTAFSELSISRASH